ncbi:hypothetical protein C5O80_06100 [Burkholderia sp. SRS-46]|nr:hypothetical protein C5O80_06100 [Burkholderia sp. SRS-46]
MTAIATGGGRWQCRNRLHVGAAAFVIATSVHVLGWLAFRSLPMTGGVARPPATQTSRRALIVEWIPVRPSTRPPRAHDAPAPVRGGPEAVARSGARVQRRPDTSVAARMATPSTNARNPKAEAATNADSAAPGAEAVRPDVPAPGIDWRRDLDAIGAPRSVGRSPAAAAIGALGASSGGIAQRHETVDETLARGVSEARRADCRRAYAGMGLLAIPALALDAVRDTGCKW